MKFSDGQWMDREGYTIYHPIEARDVRSDGKTMSVYAPYKKINDRGDTLNAPQLTIEFSAPMKDVIKVVIYHFRDMGKTTPEFKIYCDEDANANAKISQNEEEAVLASGNTSVKVSKRDRLVITYLYDGKPITGTSFKNIGYVISPEKEVYVREQLDIDVDECIYGLGERFTHFVKNGQVIDIWNKDGGTCSEQSYKNIPFYITNKGYGVFVNHPENVSFEVASEKVESVQFSVCGEYLEYYILGGASMKEVLSNYTQLTGKPALPPAWSFGLWLTTSFTTNYDEATVNSFVDGMLKRNIPLGVFHFDCFWMKEFEWCNFEWDPEVFPDPKGMLKRLKEKGLKICAWINPYIAQKSSLFKEGMDNGYLIKKPNGRVWQWDLWQAGMGIVDFTNPEACQWFAGKLKKLLDDGVDCFKTDFGERIPTDVIYHDGSDPIKMHNYYTYLYNKLVFDLLKREKGEGEACLFARSATVGGQQFPVHWGGDCTATYTSMAESLRGGLSLGLSGFGFWSHDISGFESTATPDIYKRWAAFGLLSSHSRLHGSGSYRVPWIFDEEAVDVVSYFTKLKISLMPYLYNSAVEASKNGIPMMRAMVLEFNEDPACDYLDKQYMLGSSLLVAPIFNENGIANYYLQKGTWTNLITGKKVQGGSFIKQKFDYMSMPVMVRPNSIIAVGAHDDKSDYDFADHVTLHMFELGEGCTAKATVCSMKGEAELEVIAKRSADTIIIEHEATDKPWSMILRDIKSVNAVSGAKVQETLDGVKFIPDGKGNKIIVTLC
jgi:alpha-D-xyloside xylohydrolase